jgi:hypothetical protein
MSFAALDELARISRHGKESRMEIRGGTNMTNYHHRSQVYTSSATSGVIT